MINASITFESLNFFTNVYYFLFLWFKLRLCEAIFRFIGTFKVGNHRQSNRFAMAGSISWLIIHSIYFGSRQVRKFKSQFFMVIFDPLFKDLKLFLQIVVVFLVFNGFLFILADFLIEVFLSMFIAADFRFETIYFWISFYDFFLSISHNFVFLDLISNIIYLILDGQTKLFQKLNPIVDESIFPLLQFSDIRLNVMVVKNCGSFLHFIYQSIINIINSIQAISKVNLELKGSFGWLIVIINMKNRTKNFEIQTKLGSGSYGVIYKAINKVTREVCVLKQISLGRLSEKAKKSVYWSKHRPSMKQPLWGNWFILLS